MNAEIQAAQKWDFEKHKYAQYDLPSCATTYERDMEKIVVCAACGKPMKYGDGYTSLSIHDFIGFGYAVCADCHEKELVMKMQTQKRGMKNEMDKR